MAQSPGGECSYFLELSLPSGLTVFGFFFFNDFIYFHFWLHWVSIAFLGLSPVAVSGDCFIVVCRLLIMVASLVEHRL